MEDIEVLGVVTLYNPEEKKVEENIQSYLPYINELIVWDNSESYHKKWFAKYNNIIYHHTGKNECIAPAINYASRHLKANGYQMMLIMDQDSIWEDFGSFLSKAKKLYKDHVAGVFTPYVKGCDNFDITMSVMPRRLFINSGTLLTSKALGIIGDVDEQAFPLDALDHDMALTLLENNVKAVCLTDSILIHSLGNLQRMGIFNIKTHDYNAFRTYSMTRSHIICHRKHYKSMNESERIYIYNEIIYQKIKRIMLAESNKFERLKALMKGIWDGLRYRL